MRPLRWLVFFAAIAQVAIVFVFFAGGFEPVSAGPDAPAGSSPLETRRAICQSCDIACSVSTEVRGGRVVKVRASDNPLFRDNICIKGIYAPKGFAHPDRLLHPLRRVGERGSGRWERVCWDEAMDDIGTRLQNVINEYGPEAWAVSTSQWTRERITDLVGAS